MLLWRRGENASLPVRRSEIETASGMQEQGYVGGSDWMPAWMALETRDLVVDRLQTIAGSSTEQAGGARLGTLSAAGVEIHVSADDALTALDYEAALSAAEAAGLQPLNFIVLTALATVAAGARREVETDGIADKSGASGGSALSRGADVESPVVVAGAKIRAAVLAAAGEIVAASNGSSRRLEGGLHALHDIVFEAQATEPVAVGASTGDMRRRVVVPP